MQRYIFSGDYPNTPHRATFPTASDGIGQHRTASADISDDIPDGTGQHRAASADISDDIPDGTGLRTATDPDNMQH